MGEGIRTVNDVPMWEQMALASFMQRYWADNQVSCTVTFDPKKEGPQIATALNSFQYQLKGISLLPKTEIGAYRQMPYEEITEKEYKKMVDSLKFLSFRQVKGAEADPEKFCNNDTCEIDFEQIKETQEA